MTYKVAITLDYQRALSKLNPTHQAHTNAALIKVQQGNTAVRVHALDPLPFVAFGVNQGGYRVICAREGDTLVCLHVDAHDPAYEWARRHRLGQLGPVIRVLRTETVDAPQQVAKARPPGPLHAIRDRTFRRFGVGPHAAEALRAVPDEDALFELAETLKAPLDVALLSLGLDGLEKAVEVWEAGTVAQQASLAQALAAPVNSATVWLPPPGEEALAQALAQGLDAWRVFLHPSQRRIVRHRGKGALKVSGGPGTGKTVVAVHRARVLATERFEEDPRPVLLTTFNASLATQLEAMMSVLERDTPGLAGRTQVLTLSGVAQALLRGAGEPAQVLRADTVQSAWDAALGHDTLGLSQGFYASEREQVLAHQGAWVWSAYARARRKGRDKGLDRAGRLKVHKVLMALEDALVAAGGGDCISLARRATQVAATSGSPWSAVVCDEAQDAGASELRLLAALARGADGQIRGDALFLCADGHQRLYQHPVSLNRCGIEIRGRSHRLRLNYRTTEPIRAEAVRRVEGVTVDPLDQDADEAHPLHGYRSVRGGVPPEERSFASAAAEADWIVELAGDDAPLLVLARTHSWLDALSALLAGRGLTARKLGEGERGVPETGVVLCTLHRAKGLEAPRVLIAGAQQSPARWPGAHEGAKATWARRERCLLYVGMTRARDWCGISRVG
jgi:hypothetical protein